MSVVYDNWERLVRATLRREELRISGLRTPSDISLASSFSFSVSSSPSRPPVPSFIFSGLLVGESFSYNQILQATDYLSSSNLIVHGLSGDLFYGVLEDGIRVVVKKVDLSSLDKESYLRSELEFFVKVSHPRFVPFLGHCLENWNDKFLVYKYMPYKDLSSSFSNGNVDSQSPSLDWRTRLKIAIGAAEGLCYLHHECVPPLVHRNVEARSIFIDENFEARLGRLTEVCTEKKDRNQSRISRFFRLPKGFDYEQGTSGASNVTCAYDVYCFGKVLLELVTGKLGFSADNDSSMQEWMENALPYITTNDKELFVNIMDPSLSMDEHHFFEVWAVAIVAKACLSPKPSTRPQMTYILEALQDPKSVRLSTDGSPQFGAVGPAPAKTGKPEGSKLAGTSQATDSTISSGSSTALPNYQFDQEVAPNWETKDLSNLRVYSFSEIKAATRNFRSDGILGEGGFGRVYKGRLHEKSTSNNRGSLIAVKRLKPESMQGIQEWQTEINMLGRVSHPNLIKLLGYCREDYELILVYEFMQKGSLDNHLFRRSPAVEPLPWDIRLKILIGAARGLAYLHALKRSVIFRDFKCSSILLDGSYNPKISDFGLAKMGPLDDQSHVSTRVMGTSGYGAPEYVATGHLYMKSDVYGFGVVLAETVTGLRILDRSRQGEKQNMVGWIKPRLSDKRKIKSIIDFRLEGKYPTKAAVKMAQLTRKCLDYDHKARPSMNQVVEALEHIESANDSEGT
ncbi:hypothetical protein ACH5RR_002337 [Cinchona calisaya]|uniref:non-specific serine/threonine protein kinase n=1 Tax=Cinchona calisaya TaxID=153742 RepID=A0ABD3B6L9_9GENT